MASLCNCRERVCKGGRRWLFTRAGSGFSTSASKFIGEAISEILAIMQTLSLARSLPSRNEMDLPSGCGNKTPKSRRKIILAGRYRISKKIGAGIFKAHDLALDQTVTVRGPFRSLKDYGDLWHKKARQLALACNPHFLNVLAVVSEESGDFLVSEHPRGKSVVELLGEQSRFDVEDVLTLMISLASALDLAAYFACSSRLISARYLFTESKHWIAVNPEEPSGSKLAQLCVRLDVSELVMPMKNIGSSCLTTKPRRSGFKRLAVRQAALLTYELLGGDPEDGIEVRRRFRPISDLSKSSNAVLYCGLLGSPGCRTSESFIQKLKEARGLSGSKKTKMWSVPALQTREDSTLNAQTSDVLRRFNRETKRLVAGLLSVVTFGALAFAVLLPERQLKMVDFTQAASSSTLGSLLKAAFPMPFGKEEMNAKSTINGDVPVREPRVNQGVAQFSPPSLEPMEPIAAQAANPVLVLNSQINQLYEQPYGSKWSPENKDSGRAIKMVFPRKRRKPSHNVKIRLLALWHQSLAHSSRGWTLFSVKGEENKGSYAAHAGH